MVKTRTDGEGIPRKEYFFQKFLKKFKQLKIKYLNHQREKGTQTG